MNKLSLLHALGQVQRMPHQFRFERSVNNPEGAQARRLEAIVQLSAQTAFGKEHGVFEVQTLRDLQKRVPVQNGTTVKPWVEREMNGEHQALSAEKPVFYALSSGTMGTPKMTPTTESFRKEFQTALLTSMAYTYRRYREAFEGTILYFISPKEMSRAPDGTSIGFTSGFNFSRMPKLVRSAYAVPYEVFEVKDDRARCYLTTWLTALSDVTVIGAIFPLAVTEMLRATEGDADALVRDLRRGTLRDDIALTPAERHHFLQYARVHRERAAHVERVSREDGGRLTGRAILPKLRLLYCWTSASAGHHIEALKTSLPPGISVTDAVYAANEGWANVPLADGQIGGPISINGHFYEFVEADAWDSGTREGCGAADVESGKSYRLLLTTSAGLLRYDLGDIVRCNGYYGRTPRIHFERRAGAAYNLAGEKLNEAQVQHAVHAVAKKQGLTPRFFSAVPFIGPPPRWELWVEFPEMPSKDRLEAWRSALEDALLTFMDYDRVKGFLRPIALRVLEPGAHARWRSERGAHAQTKVVNLEVRPDAFDGLEVSVWVEAPKEKER